MSPPPLDLGVVTAGLAGTGVGDPLLHETLLPSTHERARAEAAERPGGALYLAEAQTEGRGRGRRRWFSPEGLGVYLSLLLKPGEHPVPPDRLGVLGLLTAYEAACAIEEACGVRPELRWPNDLLLGGRKVAGVLAESATRGREVHHAVVSAGVNVNVPAGAFPDEIRHTATSLRIASGAEHAREPIVVEIARRLGELWERLPHLQVPRELGAWAQASPAVCGAWVRLRHAGIVREAQTHGLDPAGRLRVRFSGGEAGALADGELLDVLSSEGAHPLPD
jgi:BirA family biotin operon repressor/biotin-[acetyl-CoA-carboxylase] ligase